MATNVNAQVRRDVDGKLAAIERARTALETCFRLGSIQKEHGSLTPAQSDDLRSGVVHWNDEARALGLAEIRSTTDWEWSDDELDQIRQTLYGAEKRYRGWADQLALMESPMADQIRALQTTDERSGLAFGSRTDEIREMYLAGGGQRDYDIAKALNEQRAIANFSDADALYNADFSSRVAMYLRTSSPWLRLATVVTADDGRPLVVPELTSDLTSYTPGEGTAITESTPTIAPGTVTPSSYKSLSQLSAESYEDAQYPIMDVVAKSAARAIGLAFGAAVTTAVLAAANNGGTAGGLGGGATATFYGVDDLTDLKYGRAAPYRENGAWIMSNGAITKTAKFTDLQGRRLWQPAIANGQPDVYDGRPVFEDPALAAVGSASKSILFGDVASAVTIKMSPLRVRVTDLYNFNLDVVSTKTVLRAGAAVVDPAAIAYLVSADS